MYDLTIEYHQQCGSMDNKVSNVGGYVQTGLFDERSWPECSCPAYKYGKRTVNFGGRKYPKHCKHIRQAQKNACTWHSLYSDEEQKKEGTCPRCGKETVVVRVAV